MNESKWLEMQEIFARAVDLPRAQQRPAVEALCADDPTMAEEVLELLEEDARANPLLDGKLGDTARTLLADEALPSFLQRQIGPYRFLSLLGEGGMGVVYLAERTDIGGKVAIKLLRDAWLSPMRRERFRIEQLTLARLNHPSIARIYDSNTLDDGTPWFVMEYAEGLPLTEYWQRDADNRSIRDCLQLFHRVCEAVQYAHSHAIIHRDLKPSNILVAPGGSVKLLDFGIAKQLDFEERDIARQSSRHTVTGLRMMTPAYAAPEQMAGDAVGVYTDVYALGVLLYELLTGQLPHAANPLRVSAPGDSSATGHRPPEKPSQLIRREHPALRNQLTRSEWADLDVLTLKAIEHDPNRRYRSAGALIHDLDAFLSGRPLDAQPNKLSYTVGKFVRRNRRVLSGIAATLLLVAATIVVYTVRLERARNAAVQEATRTRRIQQFTESLFDGGDKSAGPAQDLKAADLLERGRQEAASLSADPEMQSDMQATLGGIYEKLGKLDMAEPLLVSALDGRRKALGSENRKVAGSLVALGLLRSDQGKLDDAENLIRQAVEMDRRVVPARDPDLAKAMVALGAVLEVHGKYDEARPVLEEALKLQPQNADATAASAENLTELANVEFYQSRYDRAESLNQQALAIDRRLFGERHPAVAQQLNNLGAIAMNRGNYAASEADYREALSITEAWYGADHPETAANLTALAQPITSQGRLAEAQSLVERALAIQKRVEGPVNSTVATTANQLGLIAFRREQYAAAKGYFTQAMESWRKIYGPQHPFLAIGYSNLGSICLAQNDFPCAEKNYAEAVRRLDQVSKDSFNAAVAHLKLGRTYLREGNFAAAEPQDLIAYGYLSKQVNASNNYLISVRKDLASIYDSLHQPAKAARFRSELNSVAPAKR
jgi:serine/threonine-protein kinase